MKSIVNFPVVTQGIASCAFALLLLLFSSPASTSHAEEFVWTGAVGNGTWNDVIL